MYSRAKYKDIDYNEWLHLKDPVGTLKYDGASFFIPVSSDGSLSFLSRRPSVKGGFPDRTESLPHLTAKKLPEYAGNVYNVELIHTGKSKDAVESHRVVSGILNSLPARAINTQLQIGPVRAVLHNVINPEFSTYKEKLLHMKQLEKDFGNPEILFVATPHITRKDIHKLIERTKSSNQEGVVVTSLTTPEYENIRYKIKHKITHNLRVIDIVQEIDKDGNPKQSMGALICADSKGNPVAKVGTGFTRNQRIDAWTNPTNWLGKGIQVESMGFSVNALRSPVYNGDADGDIDTLS
jgi:hypothetical protein